MAKQVKGVRDKLLRYAAEEFLEHGYEGASLRRIAEKAGTSTSSIYVRFHDKHGLYLAIVRPTAEGFKAKLREEYRLFNETRGALPLEAMFAYTEQRCMVLTDWIYDRLEHFRLLMLGSGGTEYDDFIGELAILSAEQTKTYIRAVGSDAWETGRLTPDLLHMLCSGYWNGLFEAVRHDMDRQEAGRYFMAIQRFYRAGWETVL